MRKCATPSGQRSRFNECMKHLRSSKHYEYKQQHWSSVRRITRDWLKHQQKEL